MERNTIVGIDFLIVGIAVFSLARVLDQSVSISALGFAISIIGALVLLVVPESIPKDAYKALLNDSIANIETILRESKIQARAYTVVGKDGKIRAFIPIDPDSSNLKPVDYGNLIQSMNRSADRLIVNYGGLHGLVLIHPGNELVRVAKVEERESIEVALRKVIITLSNLATSLSAIEDGKIIRVDVKNPRLSFDFPRFEMCLGLPLSSVIAGVVAKVKGMPVMILDEKLDRSLLRLSLEILE